MKKKNTLESRILALNKGETLTVKNYRDRAAAHRIATKNNIEILTRQALFTKGFVIARA